VFEVGCGLNEARIAEVVWHGKCTG